ncbi:zinc finger FYVE domain-containing protein 9 [Anopheles aquasalis]|uniref:zinc finger FYVE domain-containing protein 9 n=1 Tax=Anopheles aquasalis TaxID=42839 RepID=UPI00215AA39F|nr:zinc finger FYVE domain-containing protein 9 [Anopheles aquasalis]
MDLVDIDKVLDDLELNEDDGRSPGLSGEPSTTTNREQIKPVTRDPEPPSFNGGKSEPVAAASISKQKAKANVVNVANVFSSLNDYVNAGGTELSSGKVTDKQDANELSIPADRKPLLTPPSNSSVSSDLKTSSIAGTTSSIANSPQTETSPASSPDSSATSCSSRAVSSSRSSSPSSSSSSSVSTSDGEEQPEGQQVQLAAQRPKAELAHEKLPEEISSLSEENYVLDSSSITTLATTNEGARKAGPQTDPQDTSAFSYKNSLYSDTLSNDVINLEGISSISSIVAVDLTRSGPGHGAGAAAAQGAMGRDKPLPEAGGAPVAKDELETELRTSEANENKGNEEAAELAKRAAVGFESTMDDVSDTELESYLQELEEYDFRGVNAVETVAPPKPERVELPSPDDGASAVIGDTKKLEDPVDEASIDSRSEDSEISPSSSRGDNEDDLISQASTLEFNDLAMAAAAAASAAAIAAGNVAGSSTDPHEGPQLSADVVVSVPVDTEEVGDFPLDEDGSEIRFIDCTETESERRSIEPEDEEAIRRAGPRPERPTSLELANALTAAEGAATAAARLSTGDDHDHDQMNRASSPGHTPPSAHGIDTDLGLTLSSTSSDDFVASLGTTEHQQHQAEQLLQDEEFAARLAAADPIQSPLTATAPPTLVPLLSAAQAQLGKVQPFWVPDNATKFCMQCNQKFSVIKRRHHCRACGQLLCSACCCLKAKLAYLGDAEGRICLECDVILSIQQQQALEAGHIPGIDGGGGVGGVAGAAGASGHRQPNPNNPMEYCSVIPPLQQAAATSQPQSPISVMVPVGVLKRAGGPRNLRKDKNVIFSDGIRPGCDLTELDQNWDAVPVRTASPEPQNRKSNRVQTPTTGAEDGANGSASGSPSLNQSLIPPEEHKLPPVLKRISPTESKLVDIDNDASLVEGLREVMLTFAVQKNFHVYVTIVELSCCINRTVINFTTRGLQYVGQDEVIILLELGDSKTLPKDIFVHLNELYCEADRGNIITELGFSPARTNNFLGSKNHGGFLYVRPTYQCMKELILPEAPYLIGVLIHRWEVPWAKILPLRLMLRLGALYRYYPSPHVSVRERESVYVEIAETIVNLLADFRHFSYTIPTVRGMVIHIEDRKTRILIPRNRYEKIVKVVDGSSEQLMAMAGNFSKVADGHLVCIQNTESGCPEATQYSTQAINIEGKPRKVTGASFLVLNGSLKPNSGLLGKCNIVEDGLMVLIPAVKLQLVKEALKEMKDYRIVCGPSDGDDSQSEIVSIEWTSNDLNFNIGVTSPIDRKPFDGIPSIRVNRGTDYSNANHIIRWTEVFILKGDEESNLPGDPINMSKLSETIAKTACIALVAFLDLLASNGHSKIGLRVSANRSEMSFLAGSGGNKLAPLYSNALGQEVIATLKHLVTALQLDQHDIVIELIFHILDK